MLLYLFFIWRINSEVKRGFTIKNINISHQETDVTGKCHILFHSMALSVEGNGGEMNL